MKMIYKGNMYLGISIVMSVFNYMCLADHRPLIQHTTIMYKETADANLCMDMFEPAMDVNTAKRSAIVLFHGGGWTGGKPDQLFEHCKYFASRGMVAFSVEYRLIDGKGNTPFECVKDGKAAIRWVRTHSKQLNLDPTKIAAGGTSSGGHIAVCTAIVDGLEEGKNIEISSKPNALVLFCPVTDLSSKGQGPTGSFYTQLFDPNFIDLSKKGYSVEEWATKLLEISPLEQVRKEQCPAIIIHGTADLTTPFETAKSFCKRMEDVGNKCEIVAFKGRNHGAFTYGQPDYIAAVSAADDFLIKLGFLEKSQE